MDGTQVGFVSLGIGLFINILLLVFAIGKLVERLGNLGKRIENLETKVESNGKKHAEEYIDKCESRINLRLDSFETSLRENWKDFKESFHGRPTRGS